MAHYGRFRLANARTTGAKALSDNFDCDKARFVLIQANSGQVDVAVHRFNAIKITRRHGYFRKTSNRCSSIWHSFSSKSR